VYFCHIYFINLCITLAHNDVTKRGIFKYHLFYILEDVKNRQNGSEPRGHVYRVNSACPRGHMPFTLSP